FAPEGHPRQRTKKRLGSVIRHFGHQLRRSVLHVELLTPCHQPQRVVEGVHALPTHSTIKIRPLQLDGPDHGFDGAADAVSNPQYPMTPRTGGLLPVVFTAADMRHDRLSDAPGELLA